MPGRDEIIARLALAIAIGLLVGIERGWRERDAPAGSRTAGIRTYAIASLLGGILAALGTASASPLLLPIGFLAFALTFSWFQWHESRNDKSFSFTGVAAALAVFALGGLAVAGDYQAAAAGGAALAALLAGREVLHGMLRSLSWIELRSAVLLVSMTAIVLPLLPDRAFDPWGAINPREIWFFTVLTAALSYLGYIAEKLFGATKGLLLSCIAGSLVSSTAMTLAYARDSAAGQNPGPLAGAASIAAMISLLRVNFLVLLIAPAMLVTIAPASLAAAMIFALGGLLLFGKAPPTDGAAAKQKNPFDLLPLMIFAGLFAIVALTSTWASRYFGPESLAVTAALSGMIDVDVAVLSLVRMPAEGQPAELIGGAILSALIANASLRLLVAGLAGARGFTLRLGTITLLAASGGGLVFWLAPSW